MKGHDKRSKMKQNGKYRKKGRNEKRLVDVEQPNILKEGTREREREVQAKVRRERIDRKIGWKERRRERG